MVDPKRFDGKVSVVTGGVSGIGRASARRLAAEGSRVIVLDRNSKLWPAARDSIGSGSSFIAVDLGDLDSIHDAAEAINAQTDRVDVLINAAGVVHIDGNQNNPFLERGLVGWDPLVNVNLRAPAALVHALRDVVIRGAGSIVNVSSEGQFGARDSRWIYDVTKAGTLSLTRSLAAAFAPHGVRVNAVAPGATLTEMHLNDVKGDPEAERGLRETKLSNLLGRFASPDEIAAVICFLASPDASFMTGSTIVADGGGRGI